MIKILSVREIMIFQKNLVAVIAISDLRIFKTGKTILFCSTVHLSALKIRSYPPAEKTGMDSCEVKICVN